MKLGPAGRSLQHGEFRRLFPFLFVFFFLFLLPAFAGQPLESTVRFAVIGDSGTGDRHQTEIARQMVSWHDKLPFSLTLMLGDNFYGGFLGLGKGGKGEFREKFDEPYAELLEREVVFRAALGNHDKAEDLIQAYDRFHIDGKHGYYRFQAGETRSVQSTPGTLPGNRSQTTPLVEFFVLNTNRLKDGDPEQIAWLEQALQQTTAPWRIVFGHHPPFSTGKGWGHGPNRDLQERLHPLFAGLNGKQAEGHSEESDRAPRVHVVLSGHDHIYERFHPRDGVVYIICGSSGKLDRHSAERDPQVAAAQDESRSFMLWEANSDELLFWAINQNGVAFDCGTIDSSGAVEMNDCKTFAGSLN